MKKNSSLVKKKKLKPAAPVVKPPAATGRKRDPKLEGEIVEAALDILASVGYDCMTMNMVAAKVKAGKASLYRRWPSKAELVHDALIGMSKTSVDLETVPDTGTLREDLLAVMRNYTPGHGERKARVLGGLGSFPAENPELAADVHAQIFGAWLVFHRNLFARAVKRGELRPDADIELACQIILALTAYRGSSACQPFNKQRYAELLDKIILPALQNPRYGKK